MLFSEGDNLISLRLFGCVALIMMFTYTSVFWLYGEDENLKSVKAENYLPNIQDFETWNNEVMEHWLSEYPEYRDAVFYVIPSYWRYKMSIRYVYIQNQDRIWNYYNYDNSGYDFYEYLAKNNEQQARSILFDYNTEIVKSGYKLSLAGNFHKIEGNWLDAVSEFFGNIGEGLGNLWQIISFDIPKMPVPVRFALAIVITPLWLIMIIGLLPIFAKLIEAVGSIIPF